MEEALLEPQEGNGKGALYPCCLLEPASPHTVAYNSVKGKAVRALCILSHPTIRAQPHLKTVAMQ